jgi:hypothetical protein
VEVGSAGPADPFNPTDDKSGLLGYHNNHGDVFFLAGTNGITGSGGDALRFIVVPHGKAVLVPMLNSFDVEGPGVPGTDNPSNPEPHINSVINDWLHSVSNVFASIDGKTIVNEAFPTKFLETTEFFSMGPTRSGSLAEQAGVPAGVELKEAKATGFYLMVEGLSRGLHTIEFGGKAGEFATHTKDFLVVV